MRLARNEQDFQLVAHALDGHDGLVVDRGQLIGQRLDLQLDDIRPAMLDPHRHAQPLAGLGRKPFMRDHLQVSLASRFQLAVGCKLEPFMAARKGAHGEALFRLQGANQQQPRLGVECVFGQFDFRRLDLRVLAFDRAFVRCRAFAAGVDGENLRRQRGGAKQR